MTLATIPDLGFLALCLGPSFDSGTMWVTSSLTVFRADTIT